MSRGYVVAGALSVATAALWLLGAPWLAVLILGLVAIYAWIVA